MKEVVFVEGINSAGKDYFLDHVQQYFPQSLVYYAPKENHEHAGICNASYITYNTIFRSIEKDTTQRTAFIYRSPITETVYNAYYNRKIELEPQMNLAKLMNDFMDNTRSLIVYLDPPNNIILQRRPKMITDEILRLKELYRETLYKFKGKVEIFESFDSFIGLIDKQINSLNVKCMPVFMDVDDTLLQYKHSFRKNFPNGKCDCIGIFKPDEMNLPIVFISGRPQAFDSLQSPYFNIFKSSYNYKYAFFKRMIERKLFFIWYDDYFTIQARLADEFDNLDFSFRKCNSNRVGRLEYSARTLPD